MEAWRRVRVTFMLSSFFQFCRVLGSPSLLHMIVLVEVWRAWRRQARQRRGPSGKVSLSEKNMLVLLTVEAGTVKASSRFLPSRRVLGRAIKACAFKAGVVEVDSGSCSQGGCGFLKQVKAHQPRSWRRF